MREVRVNWSTAQGLGQNCLIIFKRGLASQGSMHKRIRACLELHTRADLGRQEPAFARRALLYRPDVSDHYA